ncbi:hypothetical protein BBJ28_00004533 [Nothophytophthora sp. Chile5]|nr:hypothetical protein BBJ28_00004533 [Nothophytophthora sp. Chile5]
MSMTIEERLRLMASDPQIRQRGQVPKAQVAAARKYQKEFVHKAVVFNTGDILDCSESLEALRNGKREARESRGMMWEDHYATQLQSEQSRTAAVKQKKLAQETTMLSQLKSDVDKWNMAIDLRLLEYIEASLSVASDDTKREYFSSINKAGRPPLHRACKSNDKELVQLLLRLGADLTVKDQSQKSIFHFMAEFRLTDLFSILVAKLNEETQGILREVDNNGQSLLHIAAANGSDGILAALLTESRRGNMRSLVDLVTPGDQQTALHLAAIRGHTACVQLLLQCAGAQAALLNHRGSNALHLALRQTFNIEQLVSAFLSYTPLDQMQTTFSNLDEETGHSCLHTAVIKNFRKVSLAMIRSGKLQINTATRDGGWTPLHLAVITEEVEIIQALLGEGATLDAIDADGQTPLLQACLGGKLEIVRLLLRAGANPSHQNKQAHSPLHYLAAFCRDRHLLSEIIAGGADVNAKSMKLNTPMHFAAMNGNEVATQVLLAHGANASVINEDKKSVVYLAKKWRHRAVEDLVQPPEEAAEQGAGGSSGGNRPTFQRTAAFRRAQVHSFAQTHGATHTRSNTSMTTRSEESDSDSLYDFEDDELILPPTTPWPFAVDNSSSNNTSNNSSRSRTPPNSNCQSFGELRERFMAQGIKNRSPLKPVVLAQDRQKGLMDELLASRSELQKLPSPMNAPLARFTRQLLAKPVQIPWEMTVPVLPSSTSDAISFQRKLKPSIRANIGLLRDHLAHAPQLQWPRHANHHVFRKTSS